MNFAAAAQKKETMNRTIDRLKIIFLTVFAVASVAVLVYHVGWKWPADKCDARGDWWDWRTRTCAHPIPIADITGRVIDTPQARAAAKAEAARRAEQAAPAK